MLSTPTALHLRGAASPAAYRRGKWPLSLVADLLGPYRAPVDIDDEGLTVALSVLHDVHHPRGRSPQMPRWPPGRGCRSTVPTMLHHRCRRRSDRIGTCASSDPDSPTVRTAIVRKTPPLTRLAATIRDIHDIVARRSKQ
jgi:hypothetical protein